MVVSYLPKVGVETVWGEHQYHTLTIKVALQWRSGPPIKEGVVEAITSSVEVAAFATHLLK